MYRDLKTYNVFRIKKFEYQKILKGKKGVAMGIRIVIDSSSDVTKEIIEKYNIVMVPLVVNFEDGSYLDKVELTTEEFFQKLSQSEKLPTTSQASPMDFVQAFKKILDEWDEVLGIFIGADFSGTYQSAVIAKEMLGDDRISACLGTFAIVLKAIELIEQNKDIKEIVDILEEVKYKVEIAVGIDTLKYLLKGGRLSKTQAIAGSLLNIKPIITVKDSKILVLDKVRGNNNVLKWMDNWISTNNFNLSDKTVFLFHARAKDRIDALRKMLVEKHGVKNIIESEVGAVIGTHTGPGVVAMGFLND
jgi:DegV family protein with EDD domain